MTKRLLVAAVAVALIATGCGEKKEAKLGGSFEHAPPKPTIVIHEPKASIKAKVAEKIHCSVELILPDGGALPTFLGVSIVKGNDKEIANGNNSFSQDVMKKCDDAQGRLLFEAKPRAPRRRGTYRLRVDAIYLINHRPGDDAGSAQTPSAPTEFRVDQIGPTIEVE